MGDVIPKQMGLCQTRDAPVQKMPGSKIGCKPGNTGPPWFLRQAPAISPNPDFN